MSAIVRLRRGLTALGLALALAAPAAAEERFLVVVGGIGGEDYYRDLFHRWTTTMVDLALEQLGFAPENVAVLVEQPARDRRGIARESRREAVEAALADVAERSRPGDLVMVLLLGHGTARGERVLFNLPGPDLPVEALAARLTALDGRTVAVVNAASASGPFVAALSAPGRVVITATASPAEDHAAQFGGHFVGAFAGGAADADKDGRVSLLEAFAHATAAVRASYERERRLLTEHALLDDDGDGAGSREPGVDPATGDGALARRVFLAAAPALGEGASAERVALEVAARGLVDRIEALKRRKREFTESDYLGRLEGLLVELALNRRAAREEGTR